MVEGRGPVIRDPDTAEGRAKKANIEEKAKSPQRRMERGREERQQGR